LDVLNSINKELEKRNSYQGIFYHGTTRLEN
jgi:radical SAM superfamily enzyme